MARTSSSPPSRYSPQHRLVGVGQNAFLAPTAHLGFGLTHLDELTQAPLLGGLGAGMTRDNGAFPLGKLPFRVVGVHLVKELGGEHVQHGIAQKFQAFVVALVGHVRA